MKPILLAMASLACATVAVAQNQAVPPAWDLNKDPIAPASIQGKVELVNGVVKLDTINSFAIPAKALGEQKDYTVEFELKLADGFQELPRRGGALAILSNRDPETHTGFAVTYLPPKWDLNGGVSNRIGLENNAFWNGETAGLDGKKFTKYSIVVKDREMAVYRNGLLQALTDAIKPSTRPLVVGGPGWRGTTASIPKDVTAIPEPYELRNLKVYDKAVEPADLNPDANVMRNCSGDQFNMQRAVIKDRTLPRILVVGDSISMGYRPFITEHFKGRAYVDYWVGGKWFDWEIKDGEFPLLRGWSGVLAQGPYDVVSYNSMTLHMWASGEPKRTIEERYPAQMEQVLDHLKKTAPNTKFIWVDCTPVTTAVEGGPSVLRQGDDQWKNHRIIYLNHVTNEIMAKRNIPVIDLYGLCEKNLDKASKDGVHWNGDASKLMAAEICKEIEAQLSKK